MIIVVGTGVAGASTAFALARRGAEVGLVDAALTGQATAAGAGIILPWSTSAEGEFYELYAAGAAYYPQLIERLAAEGVTDIGYRRSGGIVVNEDAAVLEMVETRVRGRLGSGVSRLSNGDARELFPPLAPNLDAVHIEAGARVDGRTLRDGLIAGAVRFGARMLGSAAELRSAEQRPADRRGWSLLVDGAEAGADAVVLATGAWTNRILEPLGRSVPVQPQRGQITHLRIEGVETGGWPSVHPVGDHYLVAFDGGRIAAGATRETGSGFDARVTAAGQKHVLDRALALAPGLADATFIETRVGLRPLPDHELPTVGPLDGLDGLFVNAGFGAGGLTMGPLAGERLADRMLG
ncbi:NAD(P)/FAD-dependent oxidoreductase [Leifsonia sp. NPDC058248]|uniref:NAD(P)/FAD-dependent oxidoreductase n=1 Tax=Leifsonia sp. NPDC058248 TaxID=3346402 RepID=UPI0036D825E5